MLAPTQNYNTAVRNYAIAAVSVILLSLGLTDAFVNPNRVAQQDRIDTYSNIISAGLVAQAKNLGR